jgi:hypothetical protein
VWDATPGDVEHSICTSARGALAATRLALSVVSTASVPRSLPGSEDLGNPRQGSSAPSGHAYARTSNWARHIAFLWIETLPE